MNFKTLWQHCPLFVRQAIIATLSWKIGKHDPQAPRQPIYVLGAFASSSGLGESARLYARARQREGKEVICLDITYAMHQRSDFPQGLDGVFSFDERNCLERPGTIVVHANPPQFQLALMKLGKKFLHNKSIIGYWAWEVEALPSIWIQGLRFLDAVEVPSHFVQHAIQQYTNQLVLVVPHDVPLPVRRKTEFMQDGILRCLYSFDVSSGLSRKNPEAVLRAFAKAFPHGEAKLTFKISSANAAPKVMDALQKLCHQIPNVQIITEVLDREKMSMLYLHHDVYLSLHRSEGYGLTIREAMLHGLYVVATGWSGNMDFMYGERTHAVPFTLIPICENRGPLKGIKGMWADADVVAAARILRNLHDNLIKRRSKNCSGKYQESDMLYRSTKPSGSGAANVADFSACAVEKINENK